MRLLTAKKLAHMIPVLLSVLIVACRSESPSEPTCRVADDEVENVLGDAVCLVRVDKFILTINKKGEQKLTLPTGKSDEQESAQCTAHRATWEMTGFNLEVSRFLGVDKYGNRFYHCALDAGFNGEIKEFPVPNWSTKYTSKIRLVDPFVTTDKAWQRPDDLVFIRDMFNRTNNVK